MSTNKLKETVIEAIRAKSYFTLEDLREIKKEIDLKIINLVGRKSENRTVDMLYSSISAYLSKNYKIKPIPLKSFENVSPKQYKNLVKAHDYINEFFEKSLNRKPTVTELHKLYLVYCEMVCTHMEALRNYNVNLFSVINFYQYFPGIVAQNLPNYIESGMFEAIVKDKEESVPNKNGWLCPKGGVHVWQEDHYDNSIKCNRCGQPYEKENG